MKSVAYIQVQPAKQSLFWEAWVLILLTYPMSYVLKIQEVLGTGKDQSFLQWYLKEKKSPNLY